MLFFIFSLNLDGWELVAFMIAYLIAITFSITMHEFAHAFTAHKCGDMTPKLQGRLSVNPAKHIDPIGALMFIIIGFGWAKPVQVNPLSFKNFRKGRILVSLAGVTTNFILAFISSAFYFFFYNELIAMNNVFFSFLAFFFMIFTMINLSLMIFNLLPIYPLDGFNFIDSFMKPGNKFAQFMYRYGNIVLIVLLVTPLFDIIYGFAVGGMQSLFFSFWGLFV